MRRFRQSPHSEVRPAAHAGRFYPADPDQLRGRVAGLLRAADAGGPEAPKAIIAPHAGYVYSGPVAASAYACLSRGRAGVRRVVLLGPAHYVGFRGIATTTCSAFATPLGTVGVDQAALAPLHSLGHVRPYDLAHEPEHSLEVQLPFVQVALGEVAIVPLLVGDATAEEVHQVLEALWDADATRIVVSSDLSHYHDYAAARAADQATAAAIEALRDEDLTGEDACGYLAIRGLLRSACRHGLRGRTVDLRNSGDTAGPKDRVVGYGAFVFA
jgi:AmmeMemoRadiSam system protein B